MRFEKKTEMCKDIVKVSSKILAITVTTFTTACIVVLFHLVIMMLTGLTISEKKSIIALHTCMAPQKLLFTATSHSITCQILMNLHSSPFTAFLLSYSNIIKHFRNNDLAPLFIRAMGGTTV